MVHLQVSNQKQLNVVFTKRSQPSKELKEQLYCDTQRLCDLTELEPDDPEGHWRERRPLDVKLKSFLYLFLKKLQNPLTNKKSFAIILKHVDGRLAQLGEHLPYKQRVIGSSPILSTNAISSEIA